MPARLNRFVFGLLVAAISFVGCSSPSELAEDSPPRESTKNTSSNKQRDDLRDEFPDAYVGPAYLGEEDRREWELALREVVIAFQNHEAATIRYPVDAVIEGKPAYSWRVRIAPFMDGGRKFYEKFDRRAAWDDPLNRSLMNDASVPKAFRVDPAGNTRILVFSGPGTPFGPDSHDPGRGPRVKNFADGISKTILCVVAPPQRAAPWMKPGTALPFDPEDPLASVMPIPAEGLLVGFADGHVAWLPADIKPEEFKALVTHNSGEPVSRELFER